MSLPAKVRPIKAAVTDTYHGIPVLDLHVDDPIPTPRAPERYAVRVYPDLARHLLTLNHPANRHIKPRKVETFAADMRAGLWWFTPESVVFSQRGTMENGQHRCHAVIEYGSDVWMMFDLGWPTDIISAIDRGVPRSNADAFAIESVPNGRTITAAISVKSRYDAVKGLTRGFSGLPTPSAQIALATFRDDVEGWTEAARAGERIYKALDKGLVPSIWIAAYRIIHEARPDDVAGYFQAIVDGTGEPGSATREVGDWFRRRSQIATQTGDSREPLEIVIRGFNAYIKGGRLSRPRVAGFELSRVR